MEGRSLVAPGLRQHLLLQCVSVLRAADLLTSFVVKNQPVDVSKKATGLFRCYASSSSHFNLVIPLKLRGITACSLCAAESAPITQAVPPLPDCFMSFCSCFYFEGVALPVTSVPLHFRF